MTIAWPLVVATTMLAAVQTERPLQSTPFNPQQDLLTRISRIVGEQPEDCGQVKQAGKWGRPAPNTAVVDGPIRCSLVAGGARRPFFMVLETPGFDSWTASGLLGTADGLVQSFTYDSLYGQGTLRTQACPKPRGILSADGFVLIECD